MQADDEIYDDTDEDIVHYDTFRDGKIFVCREMCETCIFHPGNLMHLQRGRVKDMVTSAIADESAITCHSTLTKEHQAVCRGYFDRYAQSVFSLRLGIAMKIVVNHDIPTEVEKRQ